MKARHQRRSPRWREPVVIIEDGDYSCPAARMDYLRQKMAAEGRMARFDGQSDQVREVWNAAGTQHTTAVLLRAGVRTFEAAEQAVAGVWDGLQRRSP